MLVPVCFSLSGTTQLSAQSAWDTLPWKQYADWKLQNLNKPSSCMRSFPLANVNENKGTPSNNNDTTYGDHLIQAYYEFYNTAYNTTGWTSPDTLNKLIKTEGNNREHPIGLLYYKFNSLATNALQDHLVDTLANGQFIDGANRPRSPYFTHYFFWLPLC